ncbi:LysR family transcriptional regulator [Pseudonocardia parietis]|uniref:DNA-binding transcriptional LysR family regulator n=1 Tax=Pseudonocardia parietis TaxID=570936 RepID=A0ABS4VU66_9PSEU|nr:LysR family transcriptional regulator [Pseudonocardia parietis]MBP2367472.1 DNA-binding transcriptional LysR family regulator [Pseudonocardia parietis]
MAFDVLDLRLFVLIAEQGSITRAAESAHLSTPSASGRIAGMERALGVTLLDRHRRGVSPTRHGALLLEHAREIVGRHDRMRLELADLSGSAAPAITVLVNTAAATLLPSVVIDFLTAHPEADLDLVEQPSHRIVAALAEGRVELGVLSGGVEHGRLDVESLGPDPLAVLVRPDHPLARSASVVFADVVDEPLVGHVQGSPLDELVHDHAAPLGRRPRYRARFSDARSVRRAVAAGVGVAIAPARHDGDGVVAIPLSDSWAARELVLATRRWSDLSRWANEFADQLLDARDRWNGSARDG